MASTKAVPFIKFANNQFQLDPQAEKFLNSLGSTKLGVISIVGKYRTGKSFFVNRVLLNQANGFSVGPTINPCTKGLWLWNQVIPTNNQDYPDMKAIVIDTEGFGGMDENVNHDTRIFLFSLLLSSYFIYNSVGNIDENALNTISLIVNLAKEIQTSGENHFPAFLWIVRDFALQMVDQSGLPIQPKEYLENALEQQKGLSDATEQKNRIRRMIKHFFKDRDCNTLVRPVETEKELQRLDQMPDNELRPEFAQQLNQLRGKIFRKVKPKTLQGAALTGPQLLNLAKAYIELINGGKVPNVESAWGYVLKAEGEKAVRECIEFAEQQIEQMKMVPFEQLSNLKVQLNEQMRKQFKHKAVGQEEDLKEYYEKMQEIFDDKFKEFKQNNKRKLKSHYQSVLNPYIEAIQDKLRNEQYNNYYELQSEMFKLRDQFEKLVGRSSKTQSYFDEVSLSIYQSAAEKLTRRAVQQSTLENKQLQIRVETLETSALQARTQMENERNRLVEVIQELEREKQRADSGESGQRAQAERLQRELSLKEEQYQQLDSQISRIKNENNQNQNNYEKQIALLQQENQFLAKSSQDKIQQGESEIKRLRSELNQIKTLNETLQQRCNSLDVGRAQEIQRLQMEFDKKIQELTSDIDSKKQSVRQQSEWMVEKSYLENQVNFLKSQLDENKRLHDALLIALQNGGNNNDYQEGTLELMETNRNLSAAMDRMESKCREQDEKIDKLRKFKNMFKNTAQFQCLHCQKSFQPTVFAQHLTICMDLTNQSQAQIPQIQVRNSSMAQISLVDLSQLQISINQTMVRETPDNKPYTEYMIKVQYQTKKWTVSRRYKNFCELHQSMIQQFPNAKLPDSSQAIINTSDIGNVFNGKRPTVIEERRKALQQYIRDLAKIDCVRNCPYYRKFLELDIEICEPNRSVSQLNSPMADIQSSRDYGRDSISHQLNMSKQFWKQNIIVGAPNTSRSVAKESVNNTTQKLKENQPTYKIDRKLLPQSPQSFLKAFQKQQESKEGGHAPKLSDISTRCWN